MISLYTPPVEVYACLHKAVNIFTGKNIYFFHGVYSIGERKAKVKGHKNTPFFAACGLVKYIIPYFEGKNATDVSDLSHQYAGWKLASYKETIPYETIYVSTTPPTAMDMKRGLELVREYGW